MSVIKVQRQHQLDLPQLQSKIDDIVLNMQNKLTFRSEWESDFCLSFQGKGAKGNITIDNQKILLTIRLGLKYRALKSSIEAEVVGIINKYL